MHATQLHLPLDTAVSDHCQRWSAGQHSWRHASEGGFTAARYTVVPLPESVSRPFVTRHHYAGSYPAARLAYGLLDTHPEDSATGEQDVFVDGHLLVGVAVFAVPMARKALTNVFPHLEPYQESLELSRFVCLPAAPANSETFFLSRAFRLAGGDGLRGVVSFADPMPRVRHHDDGTTSVLTPGHVGLLYQAASGVALGRSTARRLVYVPSAGIVLPARTLQKIRAGECGSDGAEAQLVRLGASARTRGQDRARWVTQALDEVGAVRLSHPGNFRYAWALGSPKQRRHTLISGERTRYPKPDVDRLPIPA